jgi:hypothetical protein
MNSGDLELLERRLAEQITTRVENENQSKPNKPKGSPISLPLSIVQIIPCC